LQVDAGEDRAALAGDDRRRHLGHRRRQAGPERRWGHHLERHPLPGVVSGAGREQQARGDESRRALRPGSFATAEIVVDPAQPAVLVPGGAIVSFAGVSKVLGVADGRIVERRVRTGRRVGDRVEVLEGLAAGDAVVAEPGSLSAGQAVAVES
jgi:hypothetical protein